MSSANYFMMVFPIEARLGRRTLHCFALWGHDVRLVAVRFAV